MLEILCSIFLPQDTELEMMTPCPGETSGKLSVAVKVKLPPFNSIYALLENR